MDGRNSSNLAVATNAEIISESFFLIANMLVVHTNVPFVGESKITDKKQSDLSNCIGQIQLLGVDTAQ